tara:strand:- start:3346 stop:3942 length:597 start_codon:yes stop_codon:yes gene_type:complete
MRIIAGKLKGNILYGPKSKKIRPLKDMVRESIFNFLLHSKKISFPLWKTNILDLYSGTGSFGLECLSRDADKVVFIEKEKEAIKILKKNIEKLKIKHSTKIFSEDVFNIIEKNEKTILEFVSNFKFDLIFCDPPFKNKNLNDLIKLIKKKNLLKKNGIIILHRHKNNDEKFQECFEIIEQRVYGLSEIIFGKILSSLP